MSLLRLLSLASAFLFVMACGDDDPAGTGPTPTPHAPTLSSMAPLSGGTEDTAYTVSFAALSGASNAADVDGDAIGFVLATISSGTLESNGTAVLPGDTLDAAATDWTWTPAANENGMLAAFDVTASDGTLSSDTSVLVNIEVAPVNDAPTLETMSLVPGATEDTAFTVTFAALAAAGNEADVDGDDLAFSLGAVSAGSLTQDGSAAIPGAILNTSSSAWIWTPPADENLQVTAFTVAASDGILESGPVEVVINVAAVNDAPTLTSVGVITGASLGNPFTITYAELAAAADEADIDSPVSFLLEGVSTGDLEMSGVAAVPFTSVLSASSDPWIWTPYNPGTIDAFTVLATDGDLDSGTPVQVVVEVAAPIPMAASWVGGYIEPAAWNTTGEPASGTGDAAMNSPDNVLVDSGYLYISDSQNYRVVKFDIATGNFIGWIGGIGTPPTGGAAGCDTAVVGDMTPGWCTGGTGAANSAVSYATVPGGLAIHNGILFVTQTRDLTMFDAATGAFVAEISNIGRPRGITFDANYFYLAEDGNSRVSRWSSSDYTSAGWVGTVGATTPTLGGDCVGQSVGYIAQGWCTGGDTQPGNLDGEFNRAIGIQEISGKLYVTDNNNRRLVKLDAATGAFEGWISRVDSTTPALGGDCTGQSSGYDAQGWCTGGTTMGTTNSSILFSMPVRLATDGTKLYATNTAGIGRIDPATGAFEAWIGVVGGTAPTSCVGTLPATGEPTGSWCSDGSWSRPASMALGYFDNYSGVAVGGGSLFVTDAQLGRVTRFDLATGTAADWLGARPLAHTGWTTAELPPPAGGYGDGMLGDLQAIVVDESNDVMYVAGNYRISKFVASTGAFLGWTGRTGTTPDSCDGPVPTVIPGPTNGWCRGGTPEDGFADGELSWGSSMMFDGTSLYVSDGGNSRIVRFNTDGSFNGWIGTIDSNANIGPAACIAAPPGEFTPTWCTGGAARNYDDTFIGSPTGLALDGTNLYVADIGNHRVVRIDVTGDVVAYAGWTGRVGLNSGDEPTYCDGGATPALGEATGDWCFGGQPAAGFDDGMLSGPYGLAADAGTLYVTSDRSIVRFGADGASTGWVGFASAAFVGGPCDGLTGITPTWCTGGTATLSTSLTGGYNSPYGLHLDTRDGTLYVANTGNNRIERLDAATGAVVGWAGGVETPPTDGEYGCLAAAAGEFTPGWCIGGDARSGPGNGEFRPQHVYAAGEFIYVADVLNERVVRFDRTQR